MLELLLEAAARQASLGEFKSSPKPHGSAGHYCDTQGHCFQSPSGLGGHIAKTGHSPKAKSGSAQARDLTKAGVRPFAGPAPVTDPGEGGGPFAASLGGAEKVAELRTRLLDAHPPGHFKAAAEDMKAALGKRIGAPGRGAMEVFEQGQLSDAAPKVIHTALTGWSHASHNPRTAKLWAYASVISENPNVFGSLANPTEELILTEEDLRSFHEHALKAQELTRLTDPTYDPDTDTVLMYRGVGKEIGQALNAAKKAGDTVIAQHRAVESWTARPDLAAAFVEVGGGVVVMARVPVTNIAASGMQGGLLGYEAEYVVMTPGGHAAYFPENIIPIPNAAGKSAVRSQTEAADALWVKRASEMSGQPPPSPRQRLHEQGKSTFDLPEQILDAFKLKGVAVGLLDEVLHDALAWFKAQDKTKGEAAPAPAPPAAEKKKPASKGKKVPLKVLTTLTRTPAKTPDHLKGVEKDDQALHDAVVKRLKFREGDIHAAMQDLEEKWGGEKDWPGKPAHMSALQSYIEDIVKRSKEGQK